MNDRHQRYYQLSSELAQLDDEQLGSLLGEPEGSPGWGKNQIIKLGQSKLFVKQVPVTEIEYAHMFSTKNWYDLPTYYNYGVASAGFGVFRELVAHIKTTNWVLAGEIQNFPLLYHYRLNPVSGAKPDRNIEDHQKYVEYWNNNQNIGRYLTDRAEAKYEMLLFLEHFPHTFQPCLVRQPQALAGMMADLRETITFLRKKGIIHFDAHFYNIMTDGTRPYLTDFGLVLDKRFALNEGEQAFFRKHAYYDYAQLLHSVGWLIYSIYRQLPERQKAKVNTRYGLTTEMSHLQHWQILFENIEALYADGLMKLDQHYVETVLNYEPVIHFMQTFFSSLRGNPKKDTRFSDAKLRTLLKKTGFLPGQAG